MRLLAALSISLFISASAFAQDYGLEMLNISPTPYSLSRAEATTSLPDGAASIYSNPALLVLNEESTIDLSYSSWIANVNNVLGGVNFRNDRSAVAFSFYSSGSNDYESRTQPGPSDGEFSIQYLSIAGAYSYDFGLFQLGASAQYLNEQASVYQASGYAFNFGIARTFLNDRIRTGVAYTNLGEMSELNSTATELPENFKIGISADIAEFNARQDESLPILVSASADFVNPVNNIDNKDYADYQVSDPYFNFGLGISVAEIIEFSAGYKTQNSYRPVGFGAAIHSDAITFNYALIPFNTGFGSVHSIGIQYKF